MISRDENFILKLQKYCEYLQFVLQKIVTSTILVYMWEIMSSQRPSVLYDAAIPAVEFHSAIHAWSAYA